MVEIKADVDTEKLIIKDLNSVKLLVKKREAIE